MHKTAILNLRFIVAGLIFSTLCINASTVEWVNDTKINHDVCDKNIIISGKNVIDGAVSVSAVNENVSVDVVSDSVLSGRNKDSRLFLRAAEGKKVIVHVDHNFLLKGSKHGDLMVAVQGGGEVVFAIKGGKNVTLTSTRRSHGVQLLVVMDTNAPPTLAFVRSDDCQDANVAINLGPESCLSYVAPTRVDSGYASETGKIVFDPSTVGTGCMSLNLKDNSSLLVQGRLLKGKHEFRLSDINPKQPAGLDAQLRVVNSCGSKATAGLQVVNDNKKLTALLVDPYNDDAFNKSGGRQVGFVLGANGSIILDDLSYLDYIGTRLNVVPHTNSKPYESQVDCFEDMEEVELTSCLRERNPSALIVDGNNDCHATPAQVCLNGRSAVYFRSGVDNTGHVNRATYTVDPNNLTHGAGNYVLDVQGQLDVNGQTDFANASNSNAENALQILSLAVAKKGGTVFSESQNSLNQPKVFPVRTFERDVCDRLERYNTAAFLINNRMNICNTALMHTDENHTVVEESLNQTPDVASEPTYVGGDVKRFYPKENRPSIEFCNAEFKVQTSAAVTGVDLKVPSLKGGNESFFKFYSNGYCVDAGSGRYLVLGTTQGSLAADGCSVLDRDAHLDVMPSVQSDGSTHRLTLCSGYNNESITEAIGEEEIDNGQPSVQTIFLGNGSNISVGVQKESCVDYCWLCVEQSGLSELLVKGNHFAFETRGGGVATREISGLTGEGAIFVDSDGKFSVCPCCSATIATMVVKSGNGIVDLPESRVVLDNRVSITDWDIDLTCPEDRVIVDKDQCYADYLLDWAKIVKDCCKFNPYDPSGALPCECPPVLSKNVSALPTIKGVVENLTVVRSRLGDQVNLKIDGGSVNNLQIKSGFFKNDAQVGLVVLTNYGKVSLCGANNARTCDEVLLGSNGITLVADGNGVVELNSDVVIAGNCAILRGPHFISGQKLTLYSEEHHRLIVRSGSTLDLTSFNDADQVVELAGNMQLVLEPGARIALNGGTLQLAQDAGMVLERLRHPLSHKSGCCTDADCLRVKVVGCGDIRMQNNSYARIPETTTLAIESDPDCGCGVADITWTLADNAHVNIGSDATTGGSFLIGNQTDLSDGTEAQLVSFNLILNDYNTLFEVGPLGFLGLGAQVTNKVRNSVPSSWTLNCLHNIGDVQINVNFGTFKHNQIVALDNAYASLMAIGYARFVNDQGLVASTGSYTVNFDCLTDDSFKARVLGGGNLAFIEECGLVSVTDSSVVNLSILGSKDMLRDPQQLAINHVNANPSEIYNYLQAKDITSTDLVALPKAAITQSAPNEYTIGFVCADGVVRQTLAELFNQGSLEKSTQRGAIGITNRDECFVDINDAFELVGVAGVTQCP